MPVTIANAAVYSINKGAEIAYQIDYSEGTQVRAVVSAGGWIRKEYKVNGEWKLSGKPYIVNHDKKRHGERIIAAVTDWLK